MAGEVRRADETLTLSGTEYEFLLAPEAEATLSLSPFAPKSTSGERAYGDYEGKSVIAFTDLSGGMGQDRAEDLTQYYNARDTDLRGGRLVLGPLVTTQGVGPNYQTPFYDWDWNYDVVLSPASGWYSIDTTRTKVACSFTPHTGCTALDRIWLPLRCTIGASTITVKIYSDHATNHVPDAELASTTVDKGDIRQWGNWVAAKLSTQLTVVPTTIYWVSVEHSGTADSVQWWSAYDGPDANVPTPNTVYWSGSAWTAPTNPHRELLYWFECPTLDADSPMAFLVGSGEDSITRVWGYAGRYLYYMDATGNVTPVLEGVHTPDQAKWNDDPGVANTFTDMANALDSNTGTAYALTMTNDDYLYIGDAVKFSRIIVDLGTTVNLVASVMTAQYWDGDSWEALAITDGTASSGKTLAVDGAITFTAPGGWATTAIDSDTCYWVRLILSVTPTAALDLLEITVYDGVTGYRLGADITDARFFQASADTHPYLYVALGDDTDMLKFDANIGTEQWATVTGIQATRLCAFDDLLWRSDSRHQVSGSADGSAWGTAVNVGDKTYRVRNLISWGAYLYVGKDDGLYKLTTEATYPASGSPTSAQELDFSALADDNNFALCCVHQGDLFFSLTNGIAKYTSGGVMQSITPEAGLNLAASERSYYRAGVSGLTALWVVTEGSISGPSSLMAYVEGKWHPVHTRPLSGDHSRGICIDPGLYGNYPRIWFSGGLKTCYVQMPTNTQKRWESGSLDWAVSGSVDLSWIDGNIRTIDKDWMTVKIDLRNVAAAPGPYVEVYYSTGSTFQLLGSAIRTEGINTLTFGSSTYGAKIQLRIKLYAGTIGSSTVSPQVEAIVLEYMERPADIRSFTSTYDISDGMTWRDGGQAKRFYEWVADLHTLRQSAEPMTWVSAWGTSYTVHIIHYTISSQLREIRNGERFFTGVARVQYQEVR